MCPHDSHLVTVARRATCLRSYPRLLAFTLGSLRSSLSGRRLLYRAGRRGPGHRPHGRFRSRLSAGLGLQVAISQVAAAGRPERDPDGQQVRERRGARSCSAASCRSRRWTPSPSCRPAARACRSRSSPPTVSSPPTASQAAVLGQRRGHRLTAPSASPTDLVGKKVGVPAIKTQTWMNIRAFVDAARRGLRQDRIRRGPAGPDDRSAQAGQRRRLHPGRAPGLQLDRRGTVKLIHNTDAPGNKGVPSSVYVATEDFIAKNPDTVKNFADQHLRGREGGQRQP